jgi:hypothetical protein
LADLGELRGHNRQIVCLSGERDDGVAQRSRSLAGHFEEPKQRIAGNRLKGGPSLTDA